VLLIWSLDGFTIFAKTSMAALRVMLLRFIRGGSKSDVSFWCVNLSRSSNIEKGTIHDEMSTL
jgi:hypothetical protein